MTNAKPTVGKWIVEKQNNPITQQIVFAGGHHICSLPDDDKHGYNDTANAELIVEAGNVYSETGLTPRQLQQQRDELLAALEGVVLAYSADTPDMNGCEEPELDLARQAIANAKGGAA